jgi:hypothetical protein
MGRLPIRSIEPGEETIEELLGIFAGDVVTGQHRAELAELRRKARNWDEARGIVAQHKHQGMIAYEVKAFVARDGNA